MAGLHKHKWSYLVKYAPDHFGSNQFRPPNPVVVTRWANVADLSRFSSVGDGKIDLASLGYQKLLGGGSVNQSYDILVPKASAKAIEKIEAAGGKVEITSGKEAVENIKSEAQSSTARGKTKSDGSGASSGGKAKDLTE
jgi:ribosomal protein L15